jgi:[NiFe] hydrogenase assembly HybE family chaperone
MPDVETNAHSEAVAPPNPSRVAELVASFERIGRESMRGLPFYNEALSVEAIGFERSGEGWLGILITPWFMNLMLVSDQPIPYAETANGEKRTVELPGGPVTFLCGGTEDFGMFHAHSIASPMDVYKSQNQARAAARRAIAGVRTPPQAEPAARAPSAAQPGVSRRTLFNFAGRPLSSEQSS